MLDVAKRWGYLDDVLSRSRSARARGWAAGSGHTAARAGRCSRGPESGH